MQKTKRFFQLKIGLPIAIMIDLICLPLMPIVWIFAYILYPLGNFLFDTDIEVLPFFEGFKLIAFGLTKSILTTNN